MYSLCVLQLQLQDLASLTNWAHVNYVKKVCFVSYLIRKELNFCHKLKVIIPISVQPDVVAIFYFSNFKSC